MSTPETLPQDIETAIAELTAAVTPSGETSAARIFRTRDKIPCPCGGEDGDDYDDGPVRLLDEPCGRCGDLACFGGCEVEDQR